MWADLYDGDAFVVKFKIPNTDSALDIARRRFPYTMKKGKAFIFCYD